MDGIAIATHWDVQLANTLSNTPHKYGVVFSGADKGEGDLQLLSETVISAGDPKVNFCFKFATK